MFSPIFPYVSTPINSIPHKYFKTTSNSSYDLFSTQFIIQSISYLNTYHEFIQKTILIWVLTHTHTKYTNLLGFVLTQLFYLAINPRIQPQRKDSMFSFTFGVLPTLLPLIFWVRMKSYQTLERNQLPTRNSCWDELLSNPRFGVNH